jgi:diguanylate cyclase (GGDEF)-like protein
MVVLGEVHFVERVRKALPRRGLLLVSAVGFAMLWSALLLLGLFIHSEAVETVAVLGLVLTCVVIGLVGRNQAVELRNLAHTDPLTGLSNHRGFHEALERELSRAARLGDQVSLVSIDLDDFKTINDTHGHPYGDEVLRGIGAKLRSAVRGEDIPARVGGEEFALILPGSSSDSAYEIAERAREAITRIPVHGFELSCSAGIATYPADAEDASTLCQLADGALYWAKSAGKQRTRRFDPERVKRSLSDRQADEVRAVLETPGALVPAFQPVAELSTGRLLGYEALARFPASPSRSPATWFAMAHGCGLGPAFEALAIKEALKPLGRPPGTHLAVNVSPSVLLSSAVQEVLPQDLTEIVIEVTEHEALTEDEAVREALRDLRERGARIAVDDAGAGYSGLKQLTQVKPDIVKLDRILTEGIHEEPARMALVESFVRFARRTGAVVCGEGISNLDEVSALADLDVEWGQGFVLGRPAPPWASIPAHAARVCRAGLDEAMRPQPAAQERIIAGDRGLERLSAQLAATRLRRDLEDVLPLMCAELNADEATVSLYEGGDVVETLAETRKHDRTIWDLSEYPLTARVLRSQEAVQVMVSDPETEPSEVELLLSLDYGSVLMVPIVHAGETVGVIEAYCTEERAWARTEINRARIISNQFASLIQTFAPDPERSEADRS